MAITVVALAFPFYSQPLPLPRKMSSQNEIPIGLPSGVGSRSSIMGKVFTTWPVLKPVLHRCRNQVLSHIVNLSDHCLRALRTYNPPCRNVKSCRLSQELHRLPLDSLPHSTGLSKLCAAEKVTFKKDELQNFFKITPPVRRSPSPRP